MLLKHRLLGKLLLIAAVLSSLASCTKVDIEGKKAPDFTLEKLSGGNISLSELQGKPIMLYWFSGW